MVPALTPLLTSESRLSFSLYWKPPQHRQTSEQEDLQSRRRTSDRKHQEFFEGFLVVTCKKSITRDLSQRGSRSYITEAVRGRLGVMGWHVVRVSSVEGCTWRISSLSLQKGLVESSCQTLLRSLGGYTPACQSRNVGGPDAWLHNVRLGI